MQLVTAYAFTELNDLRADKKYKMHMNENRIGNHSQFLALLFPELKFTRHLFYDGTV